MRLLGGCVVLLLAACTSTGVVPAGGDTFMIGKKTAQVGFGPPLKTEASVYAEASVFCEKQTRKVETVDLDIHNTTAARPGSVNLKFRCVDLDAPESATGVNRPDDGIDQSNAGLPVSGRDKYADLERLKNLLDDGALTQEEYDSEKAKILDD